MANLVWLNIPLCAVAFLATVGIPLRLVFTDPEQKVVRSERVRPEHVPSYELAA